jgi:hypothetical protein
MTCEEFKKMISTNPLDALPSEVLATAQHCCDCERCRKELNERADRALQCMGPEHAEMNNAIGKVVAKRALASTKFDNEILPVRNSNYAAHRLLPP